jgi:putative hemolysin
MFRSDELSGSGLAAVALPRSFDLADEIRRLPPSALLVQSGVQAVYALGASTAPALLAELGRLRAEAFPGAFAPGEIDLDAYDPHYVHLVLWDHAAGEVAGAYRLACVEEVGALRDPRRLYTSEMFEYGLPFLRRLGSAVELGRSFVRPSHQRSYAALHLLWKGIGAFVTRRGGLTTLFGALTVPHALSREARNACLDHLETRSARRPWSCLVRGRVPVDGWRPSAHPPRTMSELEVRLEGLGAGVPPLLRHYARLGARTLAFSQDHDFGGSVDALILVDLSALPRAIHERYLRAS